MMETAEQKECPGADVHLRAEAESESSSSLPLQVAVHNIPEALRARDQWVVWRLENRDDKPTKVPYNAATGYPAKSNDSATWTDLRTAVGAYRRDHYSGIGFVFSEGDGFAGVDLDHVIDTETGELEAWAVEVVERFQATYIEISPSGTGIRIFCRGKPHRCGKGTDNKRIELYDATSPRYLTVTGHHWPGSSVDVNDSQAALDWLHDAYFAPKEKPTKSTKGNSGTFTGDDAEIIRLATAAKNGGKFRALLSGDLGGYPSQSEADAALCSMLAFYTKDPTQIDRIFRASGLMRDKWDKKHHADGRTYGEATIDSAIESCPSTYGESKRPPTEKPRKANGSTVPTFSDSSPFEPPPYPIDALGPLAEAAAAIAEGGQIDPAMAGQCVLASAFLIAQAKSNVQTLADVKPLSGYLLTIGESGDGKSTAEGAALRAVREYQRNQTRLYQCQLSDWEERCADRKKKEPKPDKPREPYILTKDGTVEGIRRGFSDGLPSQGVFSAEAAVMLAGYGMNADNRAKSAGAFNLLWDDGEISVSRSTTGRIQLYDRRLSIHWLIQPDAATEAVQDTLLSNIGFWPRFLCAWPAPGKPRAAKPFRPEQDSRIGAFWDRCYRLLSDPLSEDCGNLPVLELDADAHNFVCRFFEQMEQAAKTKGGLLEPVKPFALRATEQLCRVAGVLTVFSDHRTISLQTAIGAAQLVTYSLETWRGIFGAREESAARSDAKLLLDWLAKQPGKRASETAMLQVGPKRLRSRSRRDSALSCLELAGVVEQSGAYWSVSP
jgi:hypothetical protein